MRKSVIRSSKKIQSSEKIRDRDWTLEAGLGDETKPPSEVDTSSMKAIPENDDEGDFENPEDSRKEFLQRHFT